MDLSFLGSRRFTPDETELFSAVGRLLSLAFCGCEDSGSYGELPYTGGRAEADDSEE